MIYWVLKITMIHGFTNYPYKFLEKENCLKVGKELTSYVKGSYYSCKSEKKELQ